MSSWQIEQTERNRRSFARLSKSLPAIFPPAVLARALGRSFIPPTPRLAIESYWRAHPLRADRLARALAAQTGAPLGWRWRIGRNRTERRRLPTESEPTIWVRGCAVCAANPFINSAGTLICGAPDRTRMQSGTVLVSLRGSSGTRPIPRRHSCVAFKGGAAAKAHG